MRRVALFDSKLVPTRRYYLRISWDKSKPILGYLLLNPSTANEDDDDPTSRFLKAFAESKGFGSIIIVNVISFIEHKSEVLDIYDYRSDPKNLRYIRRMLRQSDQVVVGRGKKGKRVASRLRYLLNNYHEKLHYFRDNKDKSPTQPTYMIRYMNEHRLTYAQLEMPLFTAIPKRTYL
jgi:hypothetical protein